MKSTLLSWSSGKDSAWSLHLLRQSNEYKIEGLLTTFNHDADRVAMHAVRRELVRAQADAAGIPLREVELPWPCSNDDYERIMKAECEKAVRAGIECIAFGDLFLADIREYRERQLHGSGLEPVFPVWGIPTRELAAEMIASGLRAKLTCVDCSKLDRSFAGSDFDSKLIAELPAGADPCGENGEFHSFVYAGPMFQHPIAVRVGESIIRDGFAFADVLPDSHEIARKISECA